MREKIIIHKAYKISSDLKKNCFDIYNKCLKYNKFIPTLFQDNIANATLPILYYATCNGTQIGFIHVDCLEGFYAELYGYVLPEFRNQKIMSLLFDTLLNDYDDYTMTITIDPRNRNEMNIISHFGFECVRTEYLMKTDLQKFKPQKNTVLLKSIPTESGEKYLYIEDNKIIGSCIVDKINSSCACIHDVFINENDRNQGYGLILMTSILSHLNSDFHYAILHVTKENIAAVKLYNKLGFEVVESAFVFEI